jgi:DNA-directed RNA polymerase subunit omega
MIYPSADKIEANIESKYELVILAAKRCRQIREGSRPRVETDSENPLTIALEEIAAGVIKGREDKASLAGQEAEADRQAVVGARELDVEVDEFLPDAELARAAAALGADMEAMLVESEEELDDVEPEEEEDEPVATDEDEE